MGEAFGKKNNKERKKNQIEIGTKHRKEVQ